jgi:hypothetical protein
MNLRLASRHIPFALVVLAFLASLLGLRSSGGWLIAVAVCGALGALGVADVLQPHSTLSPGNCCTVRSMTSAWPSSGCSGATRGPIRSRRRPASWRYAAASCSRVRSAR